MGPPPPKHIQKIVSLAPSLTETVCALGACEKLAGVTLYDDVPPQVSALPKIGDFHTPNTEKIALLKPDLVLAVPTSAGKRPLQALAKLGISVVVLPASSLNELWYSIDVLGTLLGHQKQAALTLRNLKQALHTPHPKPYITTVLLVGTQPLVAAGPGSYLSELLAYAGGHNALARGGAYPVIDEETLVALKPQVVVLLSMSESSPPLSSVLETLLNKQGVRVKHVHHDALLRPGPRIPEALVLLKKALH